MMIRHVIPITVALAAVFAFAMASAGRASAQEMPISPHPGWHPCWGCFYEQIPPWGRLAVVRPPWFLEPVPRWISPLRVPFSRVRC